jgi:hypothetical protein
VPAAHAARTIRVALHGFVSLEAEEGFAIDLSLDETFERLIATLDRGPQIPKTTSNTKTKRRNHDRQHALLPTFGPIPSSSKLKLKAANLAVKFFLELAAITAFAYWCSTIGNGESAILAAIAAPSTAIVLWGLFAAPKSRRRLPVATRVPFELAVFTLAPLALCAAGSIIAAITLSVVVIANSVLLTLLHQCCQ